MSNVKTIILTGEETEVNFDIFFAYAECNNLSNSEVLMSAKPNIQRGNDDVIIIKSGCSASMGDIGVPSIKTVYLKGSGEVQIAGKSFPQSSFKSASKGGGGSGSSNKPLAEMHFDGILNGYGYTDYSYNSADSSEMIITPENGIYLYDSELIFTIPELDKYNMLFIELVFKKNNAIVPGSQAVGMLKIHNALFCTVIGKINNFTFYRNHNETSGNIGKITAYEYTDNYFYKVTLIYNKKNDTIQGMFNNGDFIENNYSVNFSFTKPNQVILGCRGNGGSANTYIKECKIYGAFKENE